MSDIASTGLIERLEATQSGSRELDFDILGIIDPETHGEIRSVQRDRKLKSGFNEHLFWFDDGEGFSGTILVPAYTTSVDAALSLYIKRPERVPSDPRLACIGALKARAGMTAVRVDRRSPDHRASEALGRVAEVAGAMERTLNECVAILDRLLDGDQQRDSSSSTRSSRS